MFGTGDIVAAARSKVAWLAVGLIAAGVLVFSGCIPLYYHSYDEGYPGLSQRLDEATASQAAMHVIVVHGIGNHEPGYSTPLAEGLTGYLKLSKQMDSPPAPLVSSKGVTNWLKEYSYGDGKRRVIFHEVTWTPTTIDIKARTFAKDLTLNPHRVMVNKSLKTVLMDESLPDAVLYMNPNFRSAMQDPILQTIERVGDTTNLGPNDVIVLIASSLGSKMVFDTVVDYEQKEKVQRFAERTSDIIMLANQLPLLHLGTGTNVESAAAAQETSGKKFFRLSRQRKKNWIDKQGKPRESHAATIHIVAATDPDDLLSFPLSKEDVVPDDGDGGGVKIKVGNIYAHNAGAILGVFENPESAHDNYDLNKWLLKKLVFGY